MTLNMRKHYIDNLRWLILLILIPYHAAQAWNTWGEPNYILFEGNRAISSIIVFFSPYFMPLLFVLAGISTKFALQKRTKKEYLIERVHRLLVPLLFGTIFFMPVMTYLADSFHGSYQGGFWAHYVVFFTKLTDWTGADGGFSLGQFWFLLYLMIISMAGVCVITLLNKIPVKLRKTIPFKMVLVFGLPLPLLSELLSIGGKSFVEYTYLFLIGYYVLADEEVVDKAEKNSLLLLGVGLIATILNVYLFIWSDVELVFLNLITKCVSEWIMIIAFIGLAKRNLNFEGKISNYMNKRSFLFYIYHFIWVVLFQYILYGFVGNKTIVLYTGPVLFAYLMTAICCEISIRVPVLCFLTGTKYNANK